VEKQNVQIVKFYVEIVIEKKVGGNIKMNKNIYDTFQKKTDL
jgi:hypothetical protein